MGRRLVKRRMELEVDAPDARDRLVLLDGEHRRSYAEERRRARAGWMGCGKERAEQPAHFRSRSPPRKGVRAAVARRKMRCARPSKGREIAPEALR